MSKIKEVNFGIGFKIGDTIYVHERLKEYPRLYTQIIKHELSHTDGFNLSDIMTDLKGKHLKSVKKDYYKFLFTEKKAWYQFIPILKINGKWSIDLIMLIVWIMIISTTLIFYKLL